MSQNQSPSLTQAQVGGTPLVLLIGLALVGLIVGMGAAAIGMRFTSHSSEPNNFPAQYVTTVAALYDVEKSASDPATSNQALSNAQKRLAILSPDKKSVPLTTVGYIAAQYQASKLDSTQDGQNVLALANALNAPIANVAPSVPANPNPGSPVSIPLIIILAVLTVLVGIVWFVMLQRSQSLSPDGEADAAGEGGIANRMMDRFRRIRLSPDSEAQPATGRHFTAGSISSQQTAPISVAGDASVQLPAEAGAYRQPLAGTNHYSNGTAGTADQTEDWNSAEPAAGYMPNTQSSQAPSRGGAAVFAGGVQRSFHYEYHLGDEPYQDPFTIEGSERGVMVASAGIDPGLRLSENPDRYCSFLVWFNDDTSSEGPSVAILSEWAGAQSMPEIDQWIQQSNAETVVVVKRGILTQLETGTAVLEVICSDISYGNESGYPVHSYFQKLSLQLKVAVQV